MIDTVVTLQESSGNSEDGGDADDEFECDCTMCHDIGGRYQLASD